MRRRAKPGGAPALYLGLLIMGLATWMAGVYPASAGVLLLLASVAGLFTMVRSVPFILRRNLLPAILTLVVVWLGLLLMGQ